MLICAGLGWRMVIVATVVAMKLSESFDSEKFPFFFSAPARRTSCIPLGACIASYRTEDTTHFIYEAYRNSCRCSEGVNTLVFHISARRLFEFMPARRLSIEAM